MDVSELVTPAVILAVGIFLWREIKGLAVKIAKLEGLIESRPWERTSKGKNEWA